MIAYIPLPEHANPFLSVISSLMGQDMIDDVICVRQGKVVPKEDRERHKIINKTYRKVIELALETDDDYCVMNNSGQMHKNEFGIERLHEFLEGNPKWGAVALPAGDAVQSLEPGHVRFECIMFRLCALRKFELEPYEGTFCATNSITKSFRKNGWKVGYLEGKNSHLQDLGKGFHERAE